MFKSLKQKTKEAYHNLKKKTPFKLPFMTSQDKFDRISKEMDSLIKRRMGNLKERRLRQDDGGILTEDFMQYIPNNYLTNWDSDLIFNLRIQNHPDVYQARRYRRSLQQIMKSEKDQVKQGIKLMKRKSNRNFQDDYYFEKYYKTQMTQREKLKAAALVIKRKGLHKKYLKERFEEVKREIEDDSKRLLREYLKKFPELENFNRGKKVLAKKEEEFLYKLRDMWYEKVDDFFEDTMFILNRVLNDEVQQTQQQRYKPENYQLSTD